MNKKLTVYIDVDDTTTELMNTIVKIYNAKYNDNLKKDDITDWQVSNFLKEECGESWLKLITQDVVENATPLPNAVKYISKLMKEEDVYFLSATHPINVLARHKCLSRLFKDYDYSRFIPCTNKSLLCGDVLIDDAIHNFSSIGKNIKRGILVTQPWNKENDLNEYNGLITRCDADWELIYQTIQNKHYK